MANEKRLIDAEDIARKLKNANCAECNVVRQVQCSACWVNDVLELLDAPTVDAVEVAEYDAIVEKLENLLCHATGGQYSKAGYSWEDMERMVTDYIEECCEEAVAEEVVHGRWEKASKTMPIYRCSICKERNLFKHGNNVLSNFCPNCGAKMDGGNEDV